MVRILITGLALAGVTATLLMLLFGGEAASPLDVDARSAAPSGEISSTPSRPGTAPATTAEREAHHDEDSSSSVRSGVVMDDLGRPVGGALVYFDNSDLAPLRGLPQVDATTALEALLRDRERRRQGSGIVVIVTEDDGRFVIPGSHSGTVRVEARKDGHRPTMASLEGPDTAVVVGRAARLYGVLTNAATGRPLAEARVRVPGTPEEALAWHHEQPPSHEVVTRPDGGYSVDRVFVDQTITVSIVAPGCRAYRWNVTIESLEQRFDLAVPLGVPVAGRVVDARDASPIAGALLSISSRFRSEFVATTLADGTFSVGRRDAFPFDLGVSAEGFVPVVQPVDHPARQAGPLVVALEPCAVLTGSVRDDQGRPVAGASLELRSAAGPTAAADVDERGRFLVTDIGAPVRFETVRVTRPAAATLRLPPIEFVKPGEEVVRHVVLPTRVAGVHGLVTCDGRPVRAVVEWADGELGGRVVTDEAGRYVLDGVTAGRVDVIARLTNLSAERSVSLELRQGESRTLDIGLRSDGSTIAGTVLTVEGRPATAVGVNVSAEPWTHYATTDGEGRFAVTVPDPKSSYKVTVSVNGRTLTRFGVVAGSTKLVFRPSR